ncbi:serine hydrolase, partial [candidate division KSB1 bacterium]|nr:serine hydrolase [candidate division KSB1 bacterium]
MERFPNAQKSLKDLFALAGFLLFSLPVIACSQDASFSSVDRILEENLQSLFNGRVVCMVKQHHRLVYYKALGGYDSLSTAAIASATKNFSGALILALAQDGFFALDDSIGCFLPIFSLHQKGHCTLRQCFSHTAGWPGESQFVNSQTLTLAQAVDSIAVYEPLIYDPGTAFRYGGVSMHIAGRVAEVAAGAPWDSLFQQRLAQRCGLTDTDYSLQSKNPRIAGGIRSTPSDILKFASMILNKGIVAGDTLIHPDWIEEMWRDQTCRAPQLASPYPCHPPYNNPFAADTLYYGFGSWLDVYNPVTQYQEQISGAGAFGTYFWIDRVRNITGVVFTSSRFTQVVDPVFQIVDLVRETLDADSLTVPEITVVGGSHSLYHDPGDTVHVWAYPSLGDSLFDAWSADVPLMDGEENHARFVMPDRDVTVRAHYRQAPRWNAVGGIIDQGRVFYYFPSNTRALVFCFHGAGGSAEMMTETNIEARLLAEQLAVAGFAIIVPESRDRNSKIWSPDLTGNPDISHVQALLDTFRQRGLVAPSTPVMGIGMSNGGGFVSRVSAALNFAAQAIFCASGIRPVMEAARIPTIWCLAQQDGIVDNERALENYDALQRLAVEVEMHIHPPSPLYPLRFWRIQMFEADFDSSDSRIVFEAIRSAGL